LFLVIVFCVFFFFSSRRRHTRSKRDWSSDVCSSDLSVSYCWILLFLPAAHCHGLRIFHKMESFLSVYHPTYLYIGRSCSRVLQERRIQKLKRPVIHQALQ